MPGESALRVGDDGSLFASLYVEPYAGGQYLIGSYHDATNDLDAWIRASCDEPFCGLVITDRRTGSQREVVAPHGEFGEDYGYAIWSPDGHWVFYGGLEYRETWPPKDRGAPSRHPRCRRLGPAPWLRRRGCRAGRAVGAMMHPSRDSTRTRSRGTDE